MNSQYRLHICSKRRLSIFWYSYPVGLAQWLAYPPLTGRSWVRIPVGSYQRPSSKWYKLRVIKGGGAFMTRNALGLEFDSAVRLSKRPDSVWNCLWGHALKTSPVINRKSRVLFPGTGFLSCATWPSLPQKH